MSDEEVIAAVRLYEKGHSVEKVAERVGYAPATVWRRLKDLVDMRGFRNEVTIELSQRDIAIRTAYNAGASMGQVAKRFKVSRQRVHQILQKTGRNR